MKEIESFLQTQLGEWPTEPGHTMFYKFCLGGRTLARDALSGNKYKVLSLGSKNQLQQVKDSIAMTQQDVKQWKKVLGTLVITKKTNAE